LKKILDPQNWGARVLSFFLPKESEMARQGGATSSTELQHVIDSGKGLFLEIDGTDVFLLRRLALQEVGGEKQLVVARALLTSQALEKLAEVMKSAAKHTFITDPSEFSAGADIPMPEGERPEG
jgi:hypothetical protein